MERLRVVGPGVVAAWLLVSGAARPLGAQESGVGPIPILEDDGRSDAAEAGGAGPHEALRGADDAGPAWVDREPPPPRPDPPPGPPPTPAARWVRGYWDWDPDRGDFAWVPGTWRVAGPRMAWVDGYWTRDRLGWHRTRGDWAVRPEGGPGVVRRAEGPPAALPDEPAGAAPGPASFLVAGHHAPEGAGVAWKPGFWAEARPGWAWVPAGWERLADGWAFHEGRWEGRPGGRGPRAGVTPVSTRVAAPNPPLPDLEPLPDPAASPDQAPARHEVARPPLVPERYAGPEAGPDRDPEARPAIVESAQPAARPAPEAPAVAAGPSPMLLAWADRLVAESEGFLGGFAPASRLVPMGGSFLAEAAMLRDAAHGLRAAVAAGADQATLRQAHAYAYACWSQLAARVQAVARRRTGPNIQRALQMGFTCEQIRLHLP